MKDKQRITFLGLCSFDQVAFERKFLSIDWAKEAEGIKGNYDKIYQNLKKYYKNNKPLLLKIK